MRANSAVADRQEAARRHRALPDAPGGRPQIRERSHLAEPCREAAIQSDSRKAANRADMRSGVLSRPNHVAREKDATDPVRSPSEWIPTPRSRKPQPPSLALSGSFLTFALPAQRLAISRACGDATRAR